MTRPKRMAHHPSCTELIRWGLGPDGDGNPPGIPDSSLDDVPKQSACDECGEPLPYGGHVATPICDACLSRPEPLRSELSSLDDVPPIVDAARFGPAFDKAAAASFKAHAEHVLNAPQPAPVPAEIPQENDAFLVTAQGHQKNEPTLMQVSAAAIEAGRVARELYEPADSVKRADALLAGYRGEALSVALQRAIVSCPACCLDDLGDAARLLFALLQRIQESDDARLVRDVLGEDEVTALMRFHASHGRVQRAVLLAALRLAGGS